MLGVDGGGGVDERETVAADDELVAVAQRKPPEPLAVDEYAVEAAVVEHAHAVGLAHDQRVAARDGRVVEAHVGGEAASDAGPLARQLVNDRLFAVFVDEILAGVLDLGAYVRKTRL